MAYVYIYYDPRTNPTIPIYVGKGINGRMYEHLTECHNPLFKRKLKKIKDLGLQPIIEKHTDNLSDQEALVLEIELIKKFGRLDLNTGTLCNFTDGGEGSAGRIVLESTRKLMSEQRKGKKQTPAQYEANCKKTMSEERKEKQHQERQGKDFLTKEQRENLILLNTGRVPSEETRKLWSKQRKGFIQTDEHKKNSVKSRMEKFIYKKVKCLTNNKIYNNLQEVSDDLKLKTTAIAAVARGDRNIHKGYKFIYVN
jgi:hypothetical protein